MNCKVCNQDFGFRNDFLYIKDGLSYITCQFCNTGFLYPYPESKIFQEKYTKEEYYDDLSGKKLNFLFDFILKFSFYSSPSSYIKELRIKKRNVLDVGCGNGEFLLSLKKLGFNIFGTDFSEIALKRSQKLTNISQENFFQGDFSKINFNKNFELVSFWHVLEHVEEPRTYIKKSYSLLEEGGYIVGEVPNYDSFTLRIFKSSYNWIMVPEHINYFSESSLKYLLKEEGFKEIKIHNPSRAILNMSLSIKNFLKKYIKDSLLIDILFLFSIFISLPIMIFFSFLNKGEVLRFYARK